MPKPGESRVQVALAVYDNGKYLADLLESVLGQTHPNVDVLVRDDGSSDDTLEILARYTSRYPSTFRVLSDDEGNLGAVANFARLLEETDAPYVLFCDGDDVWLPNKVECLLDEMLSREASSGTLRPILVHADLQLVAEDLSLIAPSMWAAMSLDPRSAPDLRRSLVHNAVTANTSLMNRALVDVACPIPDEALMHDWWVSLVAAAVGEVAAVEQPLTLYRQHSTNVVGVGRQGVSYVLDRARRTFAVGGVHDMLQRSFLQARALAERVGDRASPENLALIRLWGSLKDCGPLSRRAALVRGGFRIPGLSRKLGLMVAI